MESSVFLRKQFLVNKPYQIRFIAEVILVVILAACLSAGGTYVLMLGELESEFQTSELQLLDIREAFPKVLMISAVVTFFAMALVGSFITLRETHRVIGPVDKMQRKFREMTQGDFSYMIPFRTGDVLKGLDESINIHLNNLADLFTNYDKVIREIDPLLSGLEKGDGSKAEDLQRIRTLLAELDQQADAFRAG